MSEAGGKGAIRWLLPAIILVYLALGILFALYTPAWQAPDEPAHYNYVQYMAEQSRFPVLKPGDYPASYLEEIKAAHFPPEMSIAPIRYEFHQPPLYYILATPLYRLVGGALWPMRLFSVAMGALLVLVAFWTVQAFVPSRLFLALGAAAFVAFLPMHLAMTASVNNDILAELLLTMSLLLSLRYLRASSTPQGEVKDSHLLVLLGITTGLGFITKSAVYIVLPLVLLAIAVRHLWLDEVKSSWAQTAKDFLLYLLPAFGLALPWWLRNVALYGGLDFLGLVRHNQVVLGQLRTAEFVAEHGWERLAGDFFLTTFRSFWGQFGWMGVLLDERLYQVAAILSALALIGFAIWAVGTWNRRRTYPAWQWAAGSLLLLAGIFAVASYLWYNMSFLQHQGRYLFSALVPIGLAVALGWREVLRRERAVPLAVALLLLAIFLRLVGWLPTWPLFMLLAVVVGFGIRRLLPRRADPLVHAVPYALLIFLDLASLFFFIVPQLSA